MDDMFSESSLTPSDAQFLVPATASMGNGKRMDRKLPVFPKTLTEYAAARDDLLNRLTKGLEADPRIAALWLTGSLGQGRQDAVSDIELFVVVADAASRELCAHSRMITGFAPEARDAFFRTFGRVVNIHEDHYNAPEGGTFSSVFYGEPPILVDWVFISRALAEPPENARLLFERVPEPQPVKPAPAPGDPLPEEDAVLKERMGYFWMISAAAAKHIVRASANSTTSGAATTAGTASSAGEVEKLLRTVAGTATEIDQLLGHVPEWDKSLHLSGRAEQASRLRNLCERMSQRREPQLQINAILNLE